MDDMENIKRSVDLRLGVQKALLGSITSNIRAIFFEWTLDVIMGYFIFDGPMQDQNRAELESIKLKLQSQFQGNEIELYTMRVDLPQKRPNMGQSVMVYYRKENRQ